jgi:hypothetical protein
VSRRRRKGGSAPGALSAATVPAGKRYPVRYAEQFFKDMRFMVVSLSALAIVFGTIALFSHQSIAGTYLLLALAELGVLALLYVRKQRCYCTATDDALVIQYTLGRLPIPFAAIKRVRVQPLRPAFLLPERRRYLNRPTKKLLDTPALYVRLDPRDPLHAEAMRRLHGRIVYKDELVLPIAEAEELAGQVRPGPRR